MKSQIKLFADHDLQKVENDVNNWLTENLNKISTGYMIQLSSSTSTIDKTKSLSMIEHSVLFTVMVIYNKL